jgi:hypothetical protein
VRSYTSLDIFGLEGQVPESKIKGEKVDISTIAEYAWYEWVKLWDKAAKFPVSKIQLGRDALSTAESEFLATSDTGCLGLFIRAVLDKLLHHSCAATTAYEDNNACQMVADSTAPTHQMRHIVIRDFALQDWTERNVFDLMARASNVNASDMFTKQVGNILFAHSFGLILDLLLVPRQTYGARGVSVACRSSIFPATPFEIHKSMHAVSFSKPSPHQTLQHPMAR